MELISVNVFFVFGGVALLLALVVSFFAMKTSWQLRKTLDQVMHKSTQGLEEGLRRELSLVRRESSQESTLMREEIGKSLKGTLDSVMSLVSQNARSQKESLDTLTQQMVRASRSERDEVSSSLKAFGDSMQKHFSELNRLQSSMFENIGKRIGDMTETNREKIGQVRDAVQERLDTLRQENNEKLERMRETVDEKLNTTLTRRLGESFRQVSERLESVHKGLGDMQNLAAGVGDLKKVLTNVKTRGTWGEVMLGGLLEQILSPGQYEKNACVKTGSQERVDFAIHLPGNHGESSEVLLPIDSKFPLEDYQRVVDAQEANEPDLIEESSRLLENRIRLEAKRIKEKYLNPPKTCDFAIMFVPVEGLYGEILRKPGLVEALQREHRIVLCGPTTLAAILNALQMGFRTLAIEKRSSEVWATLGLVKAEFSKFGGLLERTKKKLQEATNHIDTAEKKTRTIEKKLDQVQQLPSHEQMDAFDLVMQEDPRDTQPNQRSEKNTIDLFSRVQEN